MQGQVHLRNRLINLSHQDDIDSIIRMLLAREDERVRVIGFPIDSTTVTEIDYERQQAMLQSRGFHGVLRDTSNFKFRYAIEETNWGGSEYRGFSGSPVFALLAGINLVQPIVVGVALTGALKRIEFLSINVVTDMIAEAIARQFETTKKQSV